MIQRIQSIWLLLAGITLSCLLIFPMVTSTVGDKSYELLATGLYQKTGDQLTKLETYTPLLISTVAVAIMAIINIFNYKKRAVQKKIIMATVVLIIGLSFWCSRYAQNIPGGLENAAYKVGMFLPVIAIFFCILAMRGINNDEKLLKSADRLR